MLCDQFADLSLLHEAVLKAKLIYPSWKGFQCIDGIGPNDQILPFDLNGVNVTVGTQSSAIGIQGVALARKVVDIGNMGPLRQVDIPKRYFQTAADGPLEVLNAQQVVSLFNEQTMRFDPIRQVGSPAKEPIALRGCLSWQADPHAKCEALLKSRRRHDRDIAAGTCAQIQALFTDGLIDIADSLRLMDQAQQIGPIDRRVTIKAHAQS